MFYIAERIIRNRVFVFIADIVFMIICAFSFFSFLIGFNGGEMRFILLAVSVASCSLYLALFHRFAKFSTARLKRVKKRRKRSEKE
ncbi:MAG: hypothetical protein E7570_08390 [Ruminococcaceae bacterium]|nr:hypothetical protein [Oscillospiraceae bacterium]